MGIDWSYDDVDRAEREREEASRKVEIEVIAQSWKLLCEELAQRAYEASEEARDLLRLAREMKSLAVKLELQGRVLDAARRAEDLSDL